MLAGDVAVLMLTYIAAYFLRRSSILHMGQSRLGRPFEYYLWIVFIIVPAWLFSMQLFRLYDASVYRSVTRLMSALFKANALASMILFSAIFILTKSMISRFFIGEFIAISFAGFAIEKLAVRAAMKYRFASGHRTRRVLLVGERADAQMYLNLVREHPDWNLEIVGLVGIGDGSGEETGNGDLHSH